MRNAVNFVLFQAGWFACVLGAAHGVPLLGPWVVAAIVLVHLVFLARAGEAGLLAVVTVAGLGLTTLNTAVGAVAFPGGAYAVAGVPIWIAALWMLFASTLRHSLRWLEGRLGLAFAFGLIGSPLSYLGAERLGAVAVNPSFAEGPLVLGATWALAVPAVVRLGTFLCGPGPTVSDPPRPVEAAVVPQGGNLQ